VCIMTPHKRVLFSFTPIILLVLIFVNGRSVIERTKHTGPIIHYTCN
jgi:hypothetical protein